MPRFLLLAAAALVMAAAATPAAADHRSKSGDGYKKERSAEHRKSVRKGKAKYGTWKRYRYGDKSYYYYYSPWWGPFAGPPGL